MRTTAFHRGRNLLRKGAAGSGFSALLARVLLLIPPSLYRAAGRVYAGRDMASDP